MLSAYIINLKRSLESVMSLIYADDTTLSSTLNKFQSLDDQSQSQNINNELAKICKWSKANKRSLNEIYSMYWIRWCRQHIL